MTTIQQANVLLLGDTHGLNLSPLRALADKGVRDAAVILLGDAGFGFPGEAPNEWAGVDKVLHDMNSELYVLRGNHDNPACFRGDSGYLARTPISTPCMISRRSPSAARLVSSWAAPCPSTATRAPPASPAGPMPRA